MFENVNEKILNQPVTVEDIQFNVTLRPLDFSDFVGQEKLKDRLEIFISAAKIFRSSQVLVPLNRMISFRKSPSPSKMPAPACFVAAFLKCGQILKHFKD